MSLFCTLLLFFSRLHVSHPVTPCSYAHPCIEGEKREDRHRPGTTRGWVTSLNIVLGVRTVDVGFLQSPGLLMPVKEILPFLVNATYIKYTQIYFPACCTFNDCFHLPRFIPSCPTWQTDEASFNAIIATAAMYFSAHRAHRLSLFFYLWWCGCPVLGTWQRSDQGVTSSIEKKNTKCQLFSLDNFFFVYSMSLSDMNLNDT